MHNIEDQLPIQQFQLESGDVLLLYTDGITEAKHNEELLNNAGLIALLEQSDGKTAEDILEDILQPMECYEIDDDVSVIVIRQV